LYAALTPVVWEALDRKAWDMAREAYELCREHLKRRIASRAAGDGDRRHCLNEWLALEAINGGNHGEALAHEWEKQLRFVRMSMGHDIKSVYYNIQQLVDQLREVEREASKEVCPCGAETASLRRTPSREW